MSKFTKWVTGSIVGILLLSIVANLISARLENVPVVSSIFNVLQTIYDKMVFVLVYKMSIWIVLVALAGIAILVAIINAARKSRKPTAPEFTKYKQDVFKQWIWKWDWEPTPKGWQVVDLTPYCPKDDVRLLIDHFVGTAKCPKCHNNYTGFGNNTIENTQEILVLIEDKVTKNTYSV